MEGARRPLCPAAGISGSSRRSSARPLARCAEKSLGQSLPPRWEPKRARRNFSASQSQERFTERSSSTFAELLCSAQPHSVPSNGNNAPRRQQRDGPEMGTQSVAYAPPAPTEKEAARFASTCKKAHARAAHSLARSLPSYALAAAKLATCRTTLSKPRHSLLPGTFQILIIRVFFPSFSLAATRAASCFRPRNDDAFLSFRGPRRISASGFSATVFLYGHSPVRRMIFL